MINVLLNILISYLIGSISGSLILGKIKGVDIRELGSGNAGGTNAFRTQGFLFAFGVVLIDALKGFIAAEYISKLNLFGTDVQISTEFGILICGLTAVVGHVYPVYHGFKGGKGAGTAMGMLIALHPLSLILAVSLWVIVLVLTGFVGLGTMIGASSIPVFLYTSGEVSQFVFYPILSIILALFIIFTHRSNIQRMVAGNENRFEQAMLIKRIFS